MAVLNELGGEKIDVISWEEKPEKFIANALSPAKIVGVKVEDKNTAIVFVPEDQLSLAIGKDGRNVRLAANLTGWKIDIKTAETPAEETEGESSSAKATEDEAKASEKPKKAKKVKKTKIIEETDGEDVEEEDPSEVDAAAEEKPLSD